MWSDLFLAAGGAINFNNGGLTVGPLVNPTIFEINSTGAGSPTIRSSGPSGSGPRNQLLITGEISARLSLQLSTATDNPSLAMGNTGLGRDAFISYSATGVFVIGSTDGGNDGALQMARVETSGVTVANLPAASVGAGSRMFVTDANATTFASIVAGGGANGVPVYSDGTNWRIG
jgi:hypothetical protein